MKISQNSENENEISLKELILKVKIWYSYLVKKSIIIFMVAVLGAISGFLYAYFEKPIYKATSTFVLEESGSGGGGALLGQYAGLASMAGLDLGGGGGLFQGDNILELYRSRNMVEKALLSKVQIEGKGQLLIDRYIDINSLREKWKGDLRNIYFDQVSREKFTRLQDSIIGKVVEDINKNYLSVVKPDKKLSIIKVQVTSKDEIFAKTFNDQIVKNVNDFYVQTKTKKSLENLAILQYQTDSVRNVLNGAIYSTVAVADATPNLNPTRQILRAPAQRSQFNAEANKAILTQLVQNLELAKLSLRKETPLIQIVDQPIYPLWTEKMGALKGTVLGGVLFGFLAIFFLTLRRIYKNILIDG